MKQLVFIDRSKPICSYKRFSYKLFLLHWAGFITCNLLGLKGVKKKDVIYLAFKATIIN